MPAMVKAVALKLHDTKNTLMKLENIAIDARALVI